jgi:hypothetical protein
MLADACHEKMQARDEVPREAYKRCTFQVPDYSISSRRSVLAMNGLTLHLLA